MKRRAFITLVGGAMAAWSHAVRAQQKAMPVIGFLSPASPGPFAPFVAAFQQGLKEAGYIDGQNVAIEYRWAEGRRDRLPALATELVGHKADVILAGGPDAALAAKNVTSTIPIVFHSGDDPVAAGLIASLARPGGNLTGVSFLTTSLNAKRFELLSELVPKGRAIALLVTSAPDNPTVIREMQEAAHVKGTTLHIVEAGSVGEFETAFATLVRLQVGGLVVPTNAFFNSQREQLVALAARHAVPSIYSFRDFVTFGGLISYGANLTAVYRQDAVFVGRILKGASPSDLPVEQPTKYELVINLKTARALGLTIPQSILARADEVIE